MDNNANIVQTSELVFRRLQDDFSNAVLLLPVALAFIVVFMVVFYRQQETMSGLLKSLFIPPALITILGLAWGLWLVIYAVGGLSLALGGAKIATEYYIYGLIPLVAYPLLLGILTTMVLCFRRPTRLIPFVVVAVLSTVYLVFAWVLKPTFSWWVVLVPVLLVALIYVAMMYRQDAQTVNPFWAAFLGLLRCSVYAALAFAFLLPGCQSFDTKVTNSKVLVLFDVSGSMANQIDDLPKPGQDPENLPNRLDKVIGYVTDSSIMEQIQAKSPATVYRFGARLDDARPVMFADNKKWSVEEWRQFLFPDLNKLKNLDDLDVKDLTDDEKDKKRAKLANLYDGFTSSTNVSGSALQALLRETGHDLQAVIIFSDGQSNVSSADSLYQLIARATDPKKSTHIMTVCVGRYLQPKSITVENIQAPVQARPDDKFYVQVPVYGDGFANTEFKVELNVEQVIQNGDKWEPKPGGVSVTLSEKGKFQPAGQHAYDKVKFEIDVKELVKNKAPKNADEEVLEKLATGDWQFTAKVERHPDEHFAKEDHVSRPTQVLVNKKKLRVLLFAGGPSREYQFLRTVLYREELEGRLQLSVLLQSGTEEHVNQDVDKDRLLTAFPNTLGKENLPERMKYYDLSAYDVVIAIDPDWTLLNNTQLQNLNTWVNGTWAGGLIFVAGPIYSYQLARDEKSLGRNLTPVKELLPVILKDSRLAGFGIGLDPTRPYTLEFDPRAPSFEFMKLSEKEKKPLDSWEEYFWEGEKPPPGKTGVPYNGFFNYYPIKEVNPGGIVLAKFMGPKGNPLVVEDNLGNPPFIAVQKVGKGRSMYFGSAEFWRMRQVDEEFHQRFWIKSIRYAGSGNQNVINEHGLFLMAQKAPLGTIPIEAQLMKKSKAPFPEDFVPVVKVQVLEQVNPDAKAKQPKDFKLEPRPRKEDEPWTGWFQGNFNAFEDGKYRLSIPIPGTNKELDHIIEVIRPDPEKNNPRPNHDHLFEIATAATPILDQIEDKDLKEKLSVALQKNKNISEAKKEEVISEGEDVVRLCFDLSNADLIAECLIKVPPRKEEIKGGLSYLLDRGMDSGYTLQTDEMITWGTIIIGLVIVAILLLTKRFTAAGIVFLAGGLIVLSVFLINQTVAPAWESFPMDLSFALVIIVGLLCIEWLTRKLLRLA